MFPLCGVRTSVRPFLWRGLYSAGCPEVMAPKKNKKEACQVGACQTGCARKDGSMGRCSAGLGSTGQHVIMLAQLILLPTLFLMTRIKATRQKDLLGGVAGVADCPDESHLSMLRVLPRTLVCQGTGQRWGHGLFLPCIS